MNIILKCQSIARNIFNDLGSGFDETIYQKAFEVELRLNKLRYENIKIIPISYKGFNIGEGKLDLMVYTHMDILVIELKAIKEKMSPKEETQLCKYMTLLNISKGLLINFPQAGRRIIPTEPEFVILPKLIL